MKITKNFFFIAFLFLLFFSCSEKKELIKEPFESLDPEFITIAIFAEKGDTVNLTNGTQIIVPPNAFMHSNKKIVRGWVEVLYRELHSADDIFYSGISMKYDSAGIKNHLQTAGMFEIRALQNCKFLKINNCENCEKSIKVHMASYQNGNDYNFYFFDEEKNNWVFKKNVAPEINSRKKEIKKEIDILRKRMEEITPKQRFPVDEDCFIFDYNAFIDIFSYDSNYQKNINKSHWYGIKWSGIQAHEYAKFNGKRYHAALLVWKDLLKKEFPKWISKHKIQKILKELDTNKYLLTVISNDNKRIYSTEIEAIRPLKSLYAKKLNNWIKEYKRKVKELEEIKKRLENLEKIKKLEADVFRSYKIREFGIYNWDKIMKEENVKVFATFEIEGGKKLIENQQISCIYEDKKSVIKYNYKKNGFEILFIPNTKTKIIAVMPDNTMAIFSEQKFQEIDFEKIKESSEVDKINFKMYLKKI